MMSKHLENVIAVTLDGRTERFDKPVTIYAALTAHYGVKVPKKR